MNLMQAMQMITQYRNNPQGILQRFGIPQNLQTPDEVADYLMKNRRVTQEQINQARNFFNSNAHG